MSSDRSPLYDISGKRVYVAGHRGMVGSALVRRLAREDCEVLTATRAQVDLCQQVLVQVRRFLLNSVIHNEKHEYHCPEATGHDVQEAEVECCEVTLASHLPG